MIKEIELNGRIIQYDLIRKDVKNLNIRIKPDQSVFVSANENVSDESIEDYLREKSDYIVASIDRYAEIARYAPQPKNYIDGETFKVLGHEYRLKVIQGTKNNVSLEGAYILLQVKEPNDFLMKEKTMKKWIKNQCRETITAVCESVYPKFQKYGVEFPQIRFRNMVSRWGSCQPKRGTMAFNISLVEAPLMCIEYVVVHEFTHFLQPNHSKRFYQQLSMFMPDWKKRKSVLEKVNYGVE